MTIDAHILRGAPTSARRRSLPIASLHSGNESPANSLIADARTDAPCSAAPAATLDRSNDASARDTATTEGYAAGYREGHAEASRRCEGQLTLARQTMSDEVGRLQRQLSERVQQEARMISDLQSSVTQAIAQRLDAIEPQAVELAFSALCKVLGPDTERASLLSGLVRQAMTQLRSAKPVSIQLNPVSLALIQSRLAELEEQTACTGVEWIADATLPPTGCVLISHQGQLDAGLQTQLDSLRALWVAADRGALS